MKFVWLAATVWVVGATADLLGLPTVPFNASYGSFDLRGVKRIVVDTTYAKTVDSTGWTLIPPTLEQFAGTFAGDLKDATGKDVEVSTGSKEHDGIFITIGNSSAFTDAAGRWTAEAYSLDVTSTGITLTGASPLGAWWGTRSILQQLALNNGTISQGLGTDAAGWGTRGVMLDCGRHYYPADFLIEMCSWMSFYKQNVFHIHLDDNLYNNPNYTSEQVMDLYARFRPLSDDPRVAGLNKHPNESWTRQDFDRIQSSCAARGVTVIPEIESPGHALVISQWKPELGLDGTLDLLNISYPETIPTVETIWDVFLPWFQSTVVSIGADEYSDAELTSYETGESYNYFVNTMNDYIRNTSGKDVRIWGTFPPKSNYTNNISKDVSIQHWEFFEDNPLFDYIDNGYEMLNSDDSAYIVQKYSGSYPQQLNQTWIFHGNPLGGAFSPNIFDKNNATNNPPMNNPLVLGHVAAQWNDYGYNTSTYLEAYYAWREGLPALADKQWGGSISQEAYTSIFATLQAAAPGQNLDRTIPTKSSTILHYQFPSEAKGTVKDISGNNYDGKTNCTISGSALHIANACTLTTPLKSKGSNYTLSFSVKPASSSPGPIFTGLDSALYSGNASSTAVQLITGGNAFALNYTLPVGKWTDVKLVGKGNATYFAANGGEEMEFTTRIGVNGEFFVWASMAINAPVQVIGGGEWEGAVKDVKLEDFAS